MWPQNNLTFLEMESVITKLVKEESRHFIKILFLLNYFFQEMNFKTDLLL